MRPLIGSLACLLSVILFTIHAAHQFQLHLQGWWQAWTPYSLWPPMTDLFLAIWTLEIRLLTGLFWTYCSWEYLGIITLFVLGWQWALDRSTTDHFDPVND